jgi:hypothetical protein
MQDRCEVCENFRPRAEFGAGYRVVKMPFDVRPVHLCVGHARIAQNSGATTFEGLRELYGSGRRSFVPRRGRNTTGRHDKPRSAGRRASDVAGVSLDVKRVQVP